MDTAAWSDGMSSSDKHITRTLELMEELKRLADEAEAECQDAGCALLYCIMRDAAYRIAGQAERERAQHRVVGSRVDMTAV